MQKLTNLSIATLHLLPPTLVLHVPRARSALQVLMDLPHASTQDLEAQRVWEQAGPEGHAGNAAIEGDAPVAGGGLQVVLQLYCSRAAHDLMVQSAGLLACSAW
jgi:hypothetical protein